ncbi:hypothetical protein GCM10010273_11780 [Streptomyces lavendulocolor]
MQRDQTLVMSSVPQPPANRSFGEPDRPARMRTLLLSVTALRPAARASVACRAAVMTRPGGKHARRAGTRLCGRLAGPCPARRAGAGGRVHNAPKRPAGPAGAPPWTGGSHLS